VSRCEKGGKEREIKVVCEDHEISGVDKETWEYAAKKLV